eukprot:Nitzschia sp. Nitz4//scaffold26_size159584//119677//120796//NITZ4_002509-RA/size159584-snap-gene-0.24-mRNA-1//1//CDS//3329545136//4081//frame0
MSLRAAMLTTTTRACGHRGSLLRGRMTGTSGSLWTMNNKVGSYPTGVQCQSLVSFSSSPPENEEGIRGVLKRTQSQVIGTVLSPQYQFYALIGAGSVGAYFFTRGVLSFTSFFTHLTPTTIAKWGFFTGFGTASVLGLVGAATMDNLYIRADPVYRYCSQWVMKDESVQKVLGDGMVPGNLRSYRLDAGRIELDQQSKTEASSSALPKLIWKPPRIQMIFDVTATGPPYRTGLVTCEAVKTMAPPPPYHPDATVFSRMVTWIPRLQTTLLKVDYETGNEGKGGTTEGDETIYLVGSEQDVTRVSSRSGLSLAMLARSVHINRAASGLTSTTTTSDEAENEKPPPFF